MSSSSSLNIKQICFSIIISLISVSIALLVAEVALRIKNSDGKNYHIEMWKYSRDLKQRSSNPVLGHEHIPNEVAQLQNVEIRINEHGMRGSSFPGIQGDQRRIMFLGSSATLGWGVQEESTMTSVIEHKFNQDGVDDVVIMNAGIGNYNAKRYTELFLTKNKELKPTDIVVNYYLNDAEVLEQGGGNILIRNSEIAITFWILINRFLTKNNENYLLEHYKTIYKSDYKGFREMKSSLTKLARYAIENDIRLYFMMMPEVYDLKNYEYSFVHDVMKKIVNELGYIYIDALETMQNVEDTKSLWAMPGDPHPNAKAHSIFASGIFPVLKKQ